MLDLFMTLHTIKIAKDRITQITLILHTIVNTSDMPCDISTFSESFITFVTWIPDFFMNTLNMTSKAGTE